MERTSGARCARRGLGRGRGAAAAGLAFVAGLSTTGLVAAGLAGAALLIAPRPAAAQTQPADAAVLKIGYLKQAVDAPLPLSALDLPPADLGLAGAELAIRDNDTTGRFMKQDFELVKAEVPVGGDAARALEEMIAAGVGFVVLDAPAATVVALADAAKGRDVLLFNAGAEDDALRGESCRANVLHTAASRAMLTDALAQYLMWKRWGDWLLISGSHPDDKLLAEAYRRAAARFGAEIVEERTYEDTGGARRTDSGHVQVQKQIPVFTQVAADHDIVVVADESEIFGEYLPYRTWQPRLVAGSAGLVPATWHPAHEQWGASQLQSRFQKQAKRTMWPLDYQVWMAVRSIGEGATRTKSVDFAKVRDFIRGPEFGLGAFKGQALTFRDWDGQLRQPIIVGTPKLPVTISPQEGYLHQSSELDTLGVDRPETTCRFGG